MVPVPKSTPTPTSTPTPIATAIAPTSSTNKTSDLLSAQCVALIVKVGSQDMSAGMPSGMDEMNACQKDTGVTQVITSSPFDGIISKITNESGGAHFFRYCDEQS